MSSACQIYAISDPDTGEVRYIGKTTYPLHKRLREHLQTAGLRKHTHKNHWIKSLGAKKPRIELVEETTLDLADGAEMFWIETFRSWGFKLTNSTLGGDGIVRGSKMSAETRVKMSKSHMGKKRNPFSKQHKEAISLGRSGKQASPETKLKMGKAHCKPVVDNFGNVYPSVKAAADAVGFAPCTVCKAIQTGRALKGHMFRHHDNNL